MESTVLLEHNHYTIYGKLYQQDRQKRPLVIFCHGLGDTQKTGQPYAEALSRAGFAVLTFDFCGGSPNSISEGSPYRMSVRTEMLDLEAVIGQMKDRPDVDVTNISLIGESQGALVAEMYAVRHPGTVKRIVFLYPGFSIPDMIHHMFRNRRQIGEAFIMKWMPVGRIYAEDVWNLHPYEEMRKLTCPVLLIHGTMDDVVDIRYSKRALLALPRAKMDVMEGAGHGFTGFTRQEAIDEIVHFLKDDRTAG
ncbi:MAG: alpha/beta fold hydrolase [Eubacteriales bacterium]|jgi:pimeloyl-ACP methyl ester carboxylesterase